MLAADVIVKPIKDGDLQILTLPADQVDYAMTADKVLRVKRSIAKSRAAVYEVKIGRMERKYAKATKQVFVPDEGIPSLAMKIHEWTVRPTSF